MSPFTTIGNHNDHPALFAATLMMGGMVIGGIIGAALTSWMWSGDGDGGGRDGTTTTSDRLLPPGVKRRGLDVDEHGPSTSSSSMSPRTQYNATTDTSGTVHINFLSDVLNRLWPKIGVAMSKVMKEAMEPLFEQLLPGPVASVKFVKLDLGTVPIVVDNILVHELQTDPTTGQEFVHWEWDVVWNSASDIQIANSYVKLGVRSILLKGRMGFWMQPLTTDLPCLDAISYAFVNPPDLDLDFTGLANVADLAVMDVKSMIRQILSDVVASVVVLPAKMTYVLNPLADYRDVYTPAFWGIARLTVYRGRGYQVEQRTLLRGHDVPDVYLKLQIGSQPVQRTPTVPNSCTPDWIHHDHENDDDDDRDDGGVHSRPYYDFLLCSKEQILSIEAWDEDKGTMDGDDLLGRAEVTVAEVLLTSCGPDRTMEVELMRRERKGTVLPTGQFVTFSLDVHPFTNQDLSSVRRRKKDGRSANDGNDDSVVVGLLTVLVSQGHDLPIDKKDAASFVKVLYTAGGSPSSSSSSSAPERELGVTATVTDVPGYDALNPLYQTPFHLPLTVHDVDAASSGSAVTLQLVNQLTTVLGEVIVSYGDLLKAPDGTIRETRRVGDKGAALSFLVSLSGLSRQQSPGAAATGDSSGYASLASASTITSPSWSSEDGGGATSPPISPSSSVGRETIRVTVQRGHGFPIRRKGPFKKRDVPDPYCVVKFGSSPAVWRTRTVKDDAAPVWGDAEYRDYPLASANQVLSIDVYDANRRTKDEHYGNARVSVGRVLLNGGTYDVDVLDGDGRRTGIVITVLCQKH
jgi:hypothetical protein